jgi:hypothetical protein
MILGGWAIAGLLAIAAIVSVFHLRGNGDNSNSNPPQLAVVRSTPERTASSLVEGAARTPKPTPRRTPTARPAAPESDAGASTSRCDQLRGSPSWQPNDREWFLTNCLAGATNHASTPSPSNGYQPPSSGDAESPVGGPTPAPPATPGEPPPVPTATPQPSPGDAATAISLAVQWLRTEAPVTYDADPAACSAVAAGGAWITTCSARLAGCGQQPACLRTIGLCVVLNPPHVASARSC